MAYTKTSQQHGFFITERCSRQNRRHKRHRCEMRAAEGNVWPCRQGVGPAHLSSSRRRPYAIDRLSHQLSHSRSLRQAGPKGHGSKPASQSARRHALCDALGSALSLSRWRGRCATRKEATQSSKASAVARL